VSRPANSCLVERVHFFKDPESGCWLWLRSKDNHGYGRIMWHGHGERAHRIAYLLSKGKIPRGMFVCHSCDNPACVNPDHLWLGTQTANMQDASRKGRCTPHRKLSVAQVHEIRESRVASRKIAPLYGVCYAVINALRARRTYPNV
jgi:hypothetical protein